VGLEQATLAGAPGAAVVRLGSSIRDAIHDAAAPDPDPGWWVVMAKPANTATATLGGDRLFWGHPAQVRTARRFVLAGLAGRPGAIDRVDRDVVALLVSELVTNAVLHSASGQPDGTLLVGYQLARQALDPKRLRLRVEVRDLGGPGHPRRCQHGLESRGRRGLELVEALASRWGVGRHPRGRVVWFELELEPRVGRW
jgi:anti-sigma regulatory factor (Ser/Thr protein kinase)